jgi:hypothetical protein
MSQIIACGSKKGIVLAADGLAIDFDLQGEIVTRRIDRLFQISPHAAILTGGAIEGADMCRALVNFIREEELHYVEEIYGAALPFLNSEYELFMRKKCEIQPIDPIHHVYFVLAGKSGKDSGNPFKLHLIWTKKKLPQLDGDEIALSYTAPRVMGLEYKLNRLCQADADPSSLAEVVKQEMESLARKQEEIGPPFTYAVIDGKGFREV